MSEQVFGGCQCDQVRFTATIDDDDAILCHCRMCQRATGNVSVAFKSVRRDGVAWQGEPTWYRSSPIAQRPFCANCGTSLGFAFLADDPNMDLHVGAFDEPGRFKPTLNYGVESMHEAWLDVSDLPRMRSDENDNVTSRWKDAGAEPPAA